MEDEKCALFTFNCNIYKIHILKVVIVLLYLSLVGYNNNNNINNLTPT